MIESKLYPDRQKRALVDIDETICFYGDKRAYELAEPNQKNINKINKLKDEGWHITYWTARGGHSKRNLYKFTKEQLIHELISFAEANEFVTSAKSIERDVSCF